MESHRKLFVPPATNCENTCEVLSARDVSRDPVSPAFTGGQPRRPRWSPNPQTPGRKAGVQHRAPCWHQQLGHSEPLTRGWQEPSRGPRSQRPAGPGQTCCPIASLHRELHLSPAFSFGSDLGNVFLCLSPRFVEKNLVCHEDHFNTFPRK